MCIYGSWSCMNLAAAIDKGGEPQRFEKEMNEMQTAGVNHLRIMTISEGHGPFRMSPREWQQLARYWDSCAHCDPSRNWASGGMVA